jgi:hypothetical protein
MMDAFENGHQGQARRDIISANIFETSIPEEFQDELWQQLNIPQHGEAACSLGSLHIVLLSSCTTFS